MTAVPYVVASFRPDGRTAEISAGGQVLELEVESQVSRAATAERIAELLGVARPTAERLLLDSVTDAALPPSPNGARALNGAAPAPPTPPRLRPADWPAGPGPAAYRGLVGRLVAEADPYTEADPAAVLVQALVAFGCSIGPGPHQLVGSERHPARLNACVVGSSSKARKGTSWQVVRHIFCLADPTFGDRQTSGLSSGEGLVKAVRDPVEIEEEDPRTHLPFRRVVDVGEAEKRLLVVESEFARPLRVAQRQGNTLSAVLRQAFDNGDLTVLTKEKAKATGAHIAVIGHITLAELRRELRAVDVTNGFGNRFLWVPATRSKLLPIPAPFEGEGLDNLARDLGRAIQLGRERTRLERNPAADELWRDVYERHAHERPGIVGSLTARAEAIMLRLSLAYALLDGAAYIGVEHISSALALWEFCERGVEFLFGTATGDPVADGVLAELAERGELTRTEIRRDLFACHVDGRRLDEVCSLLSDTGRIRVEMRRTKGRSTEVWTLP